MKVEGSKDKSTSFWSRLFGRKSSGGRAAVDPEMCSGCALCLAVCPAKAIYLDGKVAVVNRDKCMDCGLCMVTCPEKAIYFLKKKS